MTRSYTWGGTNRLLAFHDGSAHYYVIADRLGSVRSILGADGSWLMSQRFTPYGERQSVDSAGSYPALPYGWTGREYGAETGFYYLRARYYLPLLRRFVQADPAGYGGGSNLYAYVGGDPLEAIDPTGRQALEPASYTPWDGTEMALFGRHLSGGGTDGGSDPSFWNYGQFWDNNGTLAYADIPINDLDRYAAAESGWFAAERAAAAQARIAASLVIHPADAIATNGGIVIDSPLLTLINAAMLAKDPVYRAIYYRLNAAPGTYRFIGVDMVPGSSLADPRFTGWTHFPGTSWGGFEAFAGLSDPNDAADFIVNPFNPHAGEYMGHEMIHGLMILDGNGPLPHSAEPYHSLFLHFPPAD